MRAVLPAAVGALHYLSSNSAAILPIAAFQASPFRASPFRASPFRGSPFRASASPSTSTSTSPSSSRILSELLSEDATTQTKLTPLQVREYESFVDSLPSPPPSLDVNGGWRLLVTVSPEAAGGDNVDFFDIASWKNYIAGSGPSPFQSLITGSSKVSGLTQWLTPEDFDNVVEFDVGPFSGKLVIKASVEKQAEDNKRTFRFRNGFFLLRAVWGGSVVLPYPVPFKLLGERAVGSLETIGYDEATGVRAAVGNKGTKFIFKRVEEHDTAPQDVLLGYKAYADRVDHDTDLEERAKNADCTLRPVLICPQQFGGKPGDYKRLADDLRARGHPVYQARISALGWLSITKSAFTEAYLKGELQPSQALPFYNNAIDEAVARIPDDQQYTILSHSIGGWVARAWLGETASDAVRGRCAKYVSLGTPHLAPPPESFVSKIDQTRGLLKYVNDRWPGAHWDNVEYTCVASKAVTGKLGLDNLDGVLAYVSYFALGGEGGVDGDGITPVRSALLDGARAVVLDDAFHADVLPNPLGGRNTRIVGCKWYGDRIDEWIDAL